MHLGHGPGGSMICVDHLRSLPLKTVGISRDAESQHSGQPYDL